MVGHVTRSCRIKRSNVPAARSAALDQEFKSQVIFGTRGASIHCGLAFTEEAFLISAFSPVNHGDGRRGNDGLRASGEPPDYL